MNRQTIGICAPSSPLPLVELECGIQKLKNAGFRVKVHPFARRRRFLFSESDSLRAKSILDFAYDPSIDIIWAGRGGYGANRVLPFLDQLSLQKIPPHKLFIGFSDSTVFLEYFRKKWKWSVLHASMPATQSFLKVPNKDWNALHGLILRNNLMKSICPPSHLKWHYSSLSFNKSGKLLGGNLSMWATMLGTKYFTKPKNSFLFFEDVGEPLLRLDRMLQQLDQAGAFSSTLGILLGSFDGCEDRAPLVWAKSPLGRQAPMKPLRKTYSQKRILTQIFGEIAEKRKIPLVLGVPSGHGTRQYPLALGGEYRVSTKDGIILEKWKWLDL